MTDYKSLDNVLDRLPAEHPGPGGAVAVLKDGKLLAQRAWGWADQERRIAFTPQSLFRICSISKQFTCATLLDRFADPDVLDGDLADFLPRLGAGRPRVVHLAHNQSGLRDYWATAMLCGSPVEAPFGPAEAESLIARTASLHFAPGLRNSYCNHNFRLLGDLVARRTGCDLGLLMRRHIFDPAGMPRALLAAETTSLPDGTVGYEGSLEGGWRPAVNRINWTGDAGVAASLEDMIAWEQAIDRMHHQPGSLIARMSAPVHFADGAPAFYGFGLARMTIHGRAVFGHGGGLRGWLSQRFYAPAERISVVVLFNHMASPRPAALALFAAALGDVPQSAPAAADPAWAGRYFEPETGLSAIVDITPEQTVGLRFAGQGKDILIPDADGSASGDRVRLSPAGDGLAMLRAGENLSTVLTRVSGEPVADFAGRFHNAEYDAHLTCAVSGGVLYGAFSGFLGNGMMQPLQPVAQDLWRLPMPRSLDHAPPGDWTLQVRRDGGRVVGINVGCWLARNILFTA